MGCGLSVCWRSVWRVGWWSCLIRGLWGWLFGDGEVYSWLVSTVVSRTAIRLEAVETFVVYE